MLIIVFNSTLCSSLEKNASLLSMVNISPDCLFTSGFFKGYLDKSDSKKCLQAGSTLAPKVIQKIGARLN